MRHRNSRNSLTSFRRSFGDSPADLAEIDKLEQFPTGIDAFTTTIHESIAGIATDMRVLLEPWDAYLAGIDTPIHFMHGEFDTWCPPTVIERLAQSLPQAKLHVVRNKGNLFAMHSFADALTAAITA